MGSDDCIDCIIPLDDLDVTVSDTKETVQGIGSVPATKNFAYDTWRDKIIGIYKKDKACVCYSLGTGKFTVAPEEDVLCGFGGDSPRFDYGKLLNLEEGDCSCC